MSSFFREDSTRVSDPPSPPETRLRFQTSVQGLPRAIGYGKARMSGNFVWAGPLTATAQQQQQQDSGKGGTGGGAAQPQGTDNYQYSSQFVLGLCEGPVSAFGTLWSGQDVHPVFTFFGFGTLTFTGTYTQTAWSYLSTFFPAAALAFRGTAYVASNAFGQGSSPQVPNISVEITFAINTGIAAAPDALPGDVISDYLTNTHYGLGFPSARLASFTTFNTMCRATGLVVSAVETGQRAASDFLKEMMTVTISEPVWSGGVLSFVPYWDTPVTGDGVTYTPNTTPQYDLTDDDFIVGDSGAGTPVACSRRNVQEAYNKVSVSYLDRDQHYNPAVTEAKDDGAIQQYGLRAKDPLTLKMICYQPAAQTCASAWLGRERIMNTYVFTVGAKYILLDPMDIVTLTSGDMTRVPVRITEIQENADRTLTMTAEELLVGSVSPPLYGTQAGTGLLPNFNEDPGSVLAPYFFEPTDQLAGGLQVWGTVVGADLSIWGGAEIWVSTDGENYVLIDRVLGPTRMGTLTATFASFPEAPTPPTLDQTSTLSVDLTVSEGQLSTVSTQDALAFSTACWVSPGEVIAFRDATSTGLYQYDLTYLLRGIYGTESEIASHPIGSTFVRLDSGVARIPFNQTQIGNTIYVKVRSFNQFGGGLQDLASLAPYSYVIQGSALFSPLPDVTDLRAGFVGMISQILWTEVTDFRAVRYEVRKGDSFLGAPLLRTVAHPPFATQGDGTYWVTAVSEPVAGRLVYSETPTSILVSGSVLVDNVVAERDLKALGWPGTFTGGAVNAITMIRTGSTGDFLAIPDFLAVTDFLNLGGEQQSGTYTMAESQAISITAPRACKVTITWLPSGEATNSDFLGTPDFLGMTDFLGYAVVARTDTYPQIRTAQGAGAGFLVEADFLGIDDFLGTGAWGWSDWQRYETAYYTGMAFQAQMLLNTSDGNVIAECLEMVMTVDVPDRVDQYAMAVAVGGTALAFQLDGADASFNGGPGTAVIPAYQGSIQNPSPGDQIVISDLTLAGCTVQVLNGGVDVGCPLVNLTFQGY